MRYVPFLTFGVSYSFRGRNVPKEGVKDPDPD